MIRSRIGLAVLSFAVLVSAAPAMAGSDFCIFRSGAPPPVTPEPLVLQDFKFPKPGECVLFSGYLAVPSPTPLSAVACTASSGLFVTFGITSYSVFSRWFDFVHLPSSNLQGNGTLLGLPETTGLIAYLAIGMECPSSLPSVP